MKSSLGAKTLLYPTPVVVIGTYDHQGKANAATAAWAGICCSQPPCVGVSFRKATHTYGNILDRKAFTVNVPPQERVKEVDYFGMASGRDADKFFKAGLTPIRGDLVDAPYVDEFPLVLECRLLQIVEIGLHTQFIGEILDVKADMDVLGEHGLPEIEKVKPIIFVPEERSYHAVGSYLGEAFSIGKEILKR
jgi:flavin reductase (DIM6/NTAB) family NADH-FMN oxidoreductase RutF